MSNRNLMIASFVGGCVALVAVFVMAAGGGSFVSGSGTVIVIAAGGGPSDFEIVVRQLLAAIVAVAVIALVIIGATNSSRERWQAFLLAALLVLGFSALTIFSIGFILAPISLAFLIISIMRLARNPSG